MAIKYFSLSLSLSVEQKRMLGNGVTPGGGAAPLWPELPNLTQNINLTPKCVNLQLIQGSVVQPIVPP